MHRTIPFVVCCLGALSAAACGAEPPRADSTSPERERSRGPALDALFDDVRSQLPRYPPPALWQRRESPPLPESWPPTAATRWIRYSFAHGFDPTTISDGVRVAAPFAVVGLDRELRRTSVERLPGAPREIGIQGVRPTHPPSGAIDGREIERLERLAVALTSSPAEGSREERELVAHYGLWLEREGTIAAALRPRHEAFFDWVERARARLTPAASKR